jgi:type II secretory pathway pseudopilin PulG
MSTRQSHGGDESGETLIELLMAMSILGLGVVAIVGGIGSSIFLSDVHRKEATAGAVVRTYAEAIEGVVAASPTAYVDCAVPSAYATPAGFSSPSGFTSSVTSVRYWSGTAFASSCPSDSGVQKVELRVTSGDTRAVETQSVIIREPCRPSDAAC